MPPVEYATFPDSEALVATWLRQAGGVIPARVYSSIPNTPTWPLLRVQRIGGLPKDRRWVDYPSLQVEVYGDTLKSQAHDIAAAARARCMAMQGLIFTTEGGDGADAEVKAVEDTLGLTWLPDPSYTPARPRYLFGIAVTLHPLVPSEA